MYTIGLSVRNEIVGATRTHWAVVKDGTRPYEVPIGMLYDTGHADVDKGIAENEANRLTATTLFSYHARYLQEGEEYMMFGKTFRHGYARRLGGDDIMHP